MNRLDRPIIMKNERFFLGDPVCNVVNLTKNVLYMGKIRKNTVFYLTLPTTYGGNEDFLKLTYIYHHWELNIHWMVQ